MYQWFHYFSLIAFENLMKVSEVREDKDERWRQTAGILQVVRASRATAIEMNGNANR